MKTEVSMDGTKFLINGRLTYESAAAPIQGMLLNSRMVQAVFDDECPETRERWRYPDTGEWNPDRNTNEFCATLPVYRDHGLLAVTVGLQGGGSVYDADVYDRYVNSVFAPDGEFKQPYFDRLTRILKAADDLGMIVIVNYFYWKQIEKMPDDDVVLDVTARTTEWLLQSGFRNILVDVANEAHAFWKRDLFLPENVHRVLDVAMNTTVGGRRLLCSVSTSGGKQLPVGKWLEMEDFSLPHGNGCSAEQLTAKLNQLKGTSEHKARPRPVMVNEDGISMDNFDAATASGCSWGFYAQGYGSGYGEWGKREREKTYDALSGYQTVPINWSINTPAKKAFFDKARELTGGAG